MNPRVVDLIVNKDFSLTLRFANGEVRRFDVAPLLDRGVFARLKDRQLFQRASVSFGTVVWPEEIDICPDTLYETGVPVPEETNPFQERARSSARQ